jgi:hypothetical protein
MAHHRIRITASAPNRIQPDKSMLEMSDGGMTHVKQGDTVTWIIDVRAMTSILIKDDNIHVNLFEPDPKPEAPAKRDSEWSGKISDNLLGGVEENYTICWSQDGETYCFDPKIQVNP